MRISHKSQSKSINFLSEVCPQYIERVSKLRCLASTADYLLPSRSGRAKEEEGVRERGRTVIRSVTSQLALALRLCYPSAAVLCRLQLTARPELRPELHISMVCSRRRRRQRRRQTTTATTVATACSQTKRENERESAL